MIFSLLLNLVLRKVHNSQEYIHLTKNQVQKLIYTYYLKPLIIALLMLKPFLISLESSFLYETIWIDLLEAFG